MTSMPASRSARATTFAPRSCPSRPGLAMTTRIGAPAGRPPPPVGLVAIDSPPRARDTALLREEPAVTDWRDAVLAGVRPLVDDGDEAPPGSSESSVWAGHGRIGRADVVVACWDFAGRGGSFGEREAGLFASACAEAAETRRPLVSMTRSGGTRLQEGMRALVGIP